MKRLRAEYNKRKKLIKKRLKEFSSNCKRSDERVFEELCFCLLTPQSKAVNCQRAIRELKKRNLLLAGSGRGIRGVLKGLARFHNKKATYIISARKIFLNNEAGLKNKLNIKDIVETREWLVKNIKGLGYKEASHFLRNIGLGRDIAILDVHILRSLRKLGVIRKIPRSITKKDYIKIEDKIRNFSRKVKIPLEDLDLLFWSSQTGFVFK